MVQPRKFKICLVGDALSGGGAEKVHALLSVFFAAKGIEVHNVIVQDWVTYQYSGALLNMGLLKDKHNGFFNKLKRFSVLRSFLKEQRFDYIIDFRMRRKPLQDWLIAKLVYNAPTVYTVHSSELEWYIPRAKWLARGIYANALGVVSITKKIKKRIEDRYGLDNVVNIYNPVDFDLIKKRLEAPLQENNFSYIVAAGSMGENNVKQFDKLIDAYSKSILPAQEVKLMILGEGSRREALTKYAAERGLSDKIVFMGFQDNPYSYMKNALFTVLSSKFEGLPMVLLESLACGTPVVSFDCFTGPSEIVVNKFNGLLIADQDFEKLTKGINKMLTDTAMYNLCKANAKSSIEKFSIENVGRQWLEYLQIELN